MTDRRGNPDSARQETPEFVYSEMAERPDPVYPKNLSTAMVLAAVFGPLGLLYTAPGAASVLIAAVFVATFINLDNAEDAWLLANGASIVIAHYIVTRHNRRATTRGGKTD